MILLYFFQGTDITSIANDITPYNSNLTQDLVINILNDTQGILRGYSLKVVTRESWIIA